MSPTSPEQDPHVRQVTDCSHPLGLWVTSTFSVPVKVTAPLKALDCYGMGYCSPVPLLRCATTRVPCDGCQLAFDELLMPPERFLRARGQTWYSVAGHLLQISACVHTHCPRAWSYESPFHNFFPTCSNKQSPSSSLIFPLQFISLQCPSQLIKLRLEMCYDSSHIILLSPLILDLDHKLYEVLSVFLGWFYAVAGAQA